MNYRVIKHFTDLKDNNYAYHEGDIFPREGVIVSTERIKELSGRENRQHTPLIEAIDDERHEEAADTGIVDILESSPKDAEKPKKKRGGKNADKSADNGDMLDAE